MDFYTTVATIIPVLYIAIVYESKSFDTQLKNKVSPTLIFNSLSATGLVSFVGEFFCLKVLILGHPDKASLTTITVAMLLLGYMVVTLPLSRLLPAMDPHG